MSLLLVVIAHLLYAHGPLPTVDDLIKSLHAPRAGITRYEVAIDAREAKGTAVPHIRRVWRDGARYRFDHLDRFDDKGSSRRAIDCTNGPEVGQFFRITYDPVFKPNHAATMRPLADRTEIGGDRRFRFEDIGATPEEVVCQAHERGLKWWGDLKFWTEKRVERCGWKGLPAYKIVLAAPDHPGKPSFEATLVPSRGFAAVASRWSGTEQGKLEVASSESEPALIAGVWLPTSSVYRQHTDGKLTAELVQKIDYVSLKKPIEAKAFSLEGLGLLQGTLVSTADGLKHWDGARLVPYR